MTISDDQQPISRIVGNRKEREISLHASGELLREGALFNESLQAFGAMFRFPQGVYRYKTHEDADRHWRNVSLMASWQRRRCGVANEGEGYCRPAMLDKLKQADITQ